MTPMFKKRTIRNPEDIDEAIRAEEEGQVPQPRLPKRTELDSSRRYGRMNVDQIVSVLATKPDPEGFYESLKIKGCVIDAEATEEVLRDMGYNL